MSPETKNLPEAVCVICVHPETGYVLSATRKDTTDTWGVIGGKKEQDESIVDSAYREFKEETGITLTSPLNYLTTMICTNEYKVTVFVVTAPTSFYVANKLKNAGRYSVEEGILVDYVPYSKLLAGPFGEFNLELLNTLLALTVK